MLKSKDLYKNIIIYLKFRIDIFKIKDKNK